MPRTPDMPLPSNEDRLTGMLARHRQGSILEYRNALEQHYVSALREVIAAIPSGQDGRIHVGDIEFHTTVQVNFTLPLSRRDDMDKVAPRWKKLMAEVGAFAIPVADHNLLIAFPPMDFKDADSDVGFRQHACNICALKKLAAQLTAVDTFCDYAQERYSAAADGVEQSAYKLSADSYTGQGLRITPRAKDFTPNERTYAENVVRTVDMEVNEKAEEIRRKFSARTAKPRPR